MEAIVGKSLCYAKICKPERSCCSPSSSISPTILQCKVSMFGYESGRKVECMRMIKPLILFPDHERNNKVGVVYASSEGEASPASNVVQGWLLEPVGDGDWKHIGFKVAMPGAYEILSSDEMVIGRQAGKADIVIPVATVSGMHARIQNKQGSLLISDLDSTNGTYINETRVVPGTKAVVPPGSLLTFGDNHLAIFRVSKIEKTVSNEPEESQEKTEIETTEVAPQP
ncbi:hypothetical protein SOVF_109050 [Spinacia oleracea]|uniref:FHA domain-containing protein n=1 Tax=Spinacia oleracea TaxID=3562 RepID=A0A9R0J199_SPIOL|nr:uncharacterized protein LOC110798614 [Spinacia oleracea]KNA14267.1 hypothetical protein SOVF_109050 [Spinacia oleracea]